MADQDEVRQRIITSVFSRRNSGGVEESYVSHLKIWEDTEDGTEKPRYILLSRSNNGKGFIHKSKLNTNGTFSVGKTWPLTELRAVEASSPKVFAVTLSRSYKWQSDDARQQMDFISALVRLFRTVTNGSAPLKIAGFRDPDAPPAPRPAASRAPGRVPSSDADTSRSSNNASPARLPGRTPPADAAVRAPSPRSFAPPVMPAAAEPFARAASPARSVASNGVPSTLRPGRARAPSTSTTASAAGSAVGDTSRVPSIVVPDDAPVPARPAIASRAPNGAAQLTASASTGSERSVARRAPAPGSLDLPSAPAAALGAVSPGSVYDATPIAHTRTLSAAGLSARPGPGLGASTSGDGVARPDPNRRVSFFDAPNQAALARLIPGGLERAGAGGGGEPAEPEADETESALETLASVEEMLEGYELGGGNASAGGARGAAQVEARLLGELLALEKANIYSFLESDDRVGLVLGYIDQAVAEIDTMDHLLVSYKIHLNTVSEDIAHIQSQNKGLQVQTQNQRSLLSEMEELLQMVQVDKEALTTLVREDFRDTAGIERLEAAATQLYKALQAGRERDMAAAMERLDEYQTHNKQFCKRLADWLSIMFNAQGKMLLGTTDGVMEGPRGRPVVISHQEMESFLGQYAGLLLYLREMDEATYARLAANYFSASSEVHAKQIRAVLAKYDAIIKKAAEEDGEATTPTSSGFRPGLRRAATLARRKDKDKEARSDGDMRACDAFQDVLECIAPLVYGEDTFIADFLQANAAGLTYADYMQLENYYRRQAARAAGLSAATARLLRSAMDLIFGFLPAELKAWIDRALAKDNLQVIGIIAGLERFLVDAEERGNAFLLGLLEKQHSRLKALFNQHVAEQIKALEAPKGGSKKPRGGIAPSVRAFPGYVARVEAQLAGAGAPGAREAADGAYDTILSAMFGALRVAAKTDGTDGEDKGQLMYHVTLIENAHYFAAEMAQLPHGAAATAARRAEAMHNENLQAYVKLVLRKPFAKIIDYFEGVERLLKTTAPSEVSASGPYARGALKKVVREFNAKDVRKLVDALAKRVERHFEDAAAPESAGGTTKEPFAPGTVTAGVWRACEDELLRLTETFGKRIAQCYADSGVGLEYSAADVEAAFKKHHVGG